MRLLSELDYSKDNIISGFLDKASYNKGLDLDTLINEYSEDEAITDILGHGFGAVEWFKHNSEKVDDYLREFGYSGNIMSDVEAAVIQEFREELYDKKEKILQTFAFQILDSQGFEELSDAEFNQLEDCIANANCLENVEEYCNQLIEQVDKNIRENRR